MADIVVANNDESMLQVENALSEPLNINVEVLEENGEEYTPNEISAIDKAISERNGSLIEKLLNDGSPLTPKSFQIANKVADKNVLIVLSDKTQETIKKMYKSHNYMAFKNKLIDFSSHNLYIFAFNVSQANFIAARRHNKAVIIDAGIHNGKLIKKYKEINKNYPKLIEELNLVLQGTKVDLVLITHPHEDHFSFLPVLLHNFKESFQSTKYVFGGYKKDYEELIESIGEDKIKFLGYSYNSRTYRCLDGLEIKIWGQENPNIYEINQISFISTIHINGRGVMFTGDANEKNLQNLKIDIPDIPNIASHPEIKTFLVDIQATIKRCRESMKNATKIVFQKLKEFMEKNKCDVDLEEAIHHMLGLKETVLIFEPHHGSLANHDFYKYFSAQDPKKVFCISSDPRGKSRLPNEESFVGRVKEPKVKEHPVVYATFDKIPTMNVTTDPVYTTGSCCDGMHVFSLSPDGNLSVLDLTEETPEWEKFNIDYSSMNTNKGPMNTNNDSMNISNDSMNTSNDSMNTNNDSMNTNNDSMNTNNDSMNISNDSMNTSNDSMNTSNDSMNTSNDSMNASNDSMNASNDSMNASNDSMNTNKDSMNSNKDSMNTNNDSMNTNNDSMNTNNDSMNTNNDSMNTNNDSMNISNDSMNTSNDSMNISNDSMNTNNDSMNISNNPMNN
ncbi:metallo-beta-lactamase superfamily protein [Trichomonas vaginalis G3]|uniref:Metallo-beta-lactamase superfamily protein n=1 Tax=Trichomonas vaginalis (strain ATCC PRA-98 / G3) TaxID=412133 RepID=A2E3J2_TRIV3|nr:LRRGT00142-related family [Trichomonas vaginalis G3]EAY12758.1 metallo-beta-lactamase superfamily protein [Trichomonas vaginalis G3]KAI5539678.1 LRRGT00142-related family [Trichomonas vaginalis G3]|eukprot:XP_001324981.1 metallo-beta-lactamase superfamily protein [Trichomonas vaginalis G3]